jgi:hypothetical protein
MQHDESTTEVLEHLAAFRERNRRFAQGVQWYRQWLSEYRTQFEEMQQRLMAQRTTVDPPSALPATTPLTAPSDVTDAQWEWVAPVLTIPHARRRPYVDARRTLNGMRSVALHRLWVESSSGALWQLRHLLASPPALETDQSVGHCHLPPRLIGRT